MSTEEFNEQFRQRTKAFAVAVIRFCENLPSTQATRVITYQLIKAATSVAANYRAFCRGRSRAEYYAKICIVVEEADESLFWFEAIHDAEIDRSDTLKYLTGEATEILKIVAKIKTRLGPNRFRSWQIHLAQAQ